MNRIKNITLIFGHFEKEHLGKDVFLVPYYLEKLYGGKTTIVYSKTETNREIPSHVRGVDLCPLKQKDGTYFGLLYLLCHFWKIDLLMQFHISRRTLILGLIYKLLKPKGILYVKADGLGDIRYEKELKDEKKLKSKVIYSLYKSLFKRVDRITIETEEGYKKLKGVHFGVDIKSKVFLMSNGFDEEELGSMNITVQDVEKKDNILLTVGRIGSYYKNSEMFLEALKQVDLKDWKAVFVGPIEEKECDFQVYIDSFFHQNPNMKKSVLFVGPIYDKRELWSWFNRSKVFVLTSRSESFGIVLMEAFRFHNYIISTEVGFAKEAISYGYGDLVEQEDVVGLARRLQDIVDGKIRLDDGDTQRSTLFNEYSWEQQVIRNLMFE